MNEIRYETPVENVDWNQPSVFLAGPTVRGHQPHLTSWRHEATRLFKEKGFDGNLIIPEFSNKTESDKYRYDVPVWEFAGLRNSHIIMFWIPRTKELIGLTTNYELGYWVARHRNKVIYGRPDNAYRMTYCDIMWVEDSKQYDKYASKEIHNTLEKTILASLSRLDTDAHRFAKELGT
jgi:nucleoside 2-deoxyribosyltransferase